MFVARYHCGLGEVHRWGRACVWQVVQALRKVASLGRSVVCTIHQPSAELFFHFDDLLLLQVCVCVCVCGASGARCATSTCL